jgi:hypothetical protein
VKRGRLEHVQTKRTSRVAEDRFQNERVNVKERRKELRIRRKIKAERFDLISTFDQP